MNEIMPVTELQKIATIMGQAKMFGKTAAELLPLMLIAQAEGKHPAIAAQEYDIIQGRPAINSRAALSRFQLAGGKIEWKTRTDKAATAVFSHPQGGSLSITWTMERAALAGLTSKDNWKKYPAQMLSARVVAEGVRAVYPACLSGLYTVEEVQDFDPPRTERNVTPDPIPAVAVSEAAPEVTEPAVPPEDTRAAVMAKIAEIMSSGIFSPEEVAFYRAEVKGKGADALKQILTDAEKAAAAKRPTAADEKVVAETLF